MRALATNRKVIPTNQGCMQLHSIQLGTHLSRRVPKEYAHMVKLTLEEVPARTVMGKSFL
jgi:hypothetical protein